EGAPEVMEMATDRVRPAVQSYRGGVVRMEVGEELSEGLRRVSAEAGATMYMTLMSSYKVLLSKYSGEEDVVVGTPIANRLRRELEGVIGFFANTLVMRTRVRGEERYEEVLRKEKEVAIGGYSHQELPFEKLVEEVSPERRLSHNPLF